MNDQNLEGKGFDVNPDHINRKGKQKGTKNRSTIARHVLNLMATVPRDSKTTASALRFFPELQDKLSADELMNIIQAVKAMTGDTAAYRAIQDSAYGMPKQETDINFQNERPVIVIQKDKMPDDPDGSIPED